jgi:histone acetyltransferase (RNA polymerase elongator complex component)
MTDDEFIKFMHSIPYGKKDCCPHGKCFYCSECFDKKSDKIKKEEVIK